MTGACDECLRRGHLLGFLAPRIAGVLATRERRTAGLLALSDDDLIAAICGTEERARSARRFLRRFRPATAREEGARLGVGTSCPHGEGHPRALGDLADPPAALFFTGSGDALRRLGNTEAVTIVGTRHPSPYGVEMAQSLGRGLAAAGVSVISGLALGIDAAAHDGACSSPAGTPVAVIARGPEAAYPARHRGLYSRIRERGCVVSELPPGTPVFRWAFPARNRIMAALARVTIVVEAADPSGSLITSAFAADLGRVVAAVPGRATARRAQGSNKLLRDGAEVVLGAADVLELLFGVGGGPAAASACPEPEVDAELRLVLDAVESCDGMHELATATRLGARELRAALGRLELLGLVRRDGAGSYLRTAP